MSNKYIFEYDKSEDDTLIYIYSYDQFYRHRFSDWPMFVKKYDDVFKCFTSTVIVNNTTAYNRRELILKVAQHFLQTLAQRFNCCFISNFDEKLPRFTLICDLKYWKEFKFMIRTFVCDNNEIEHLQLLQTPYHISLPVNANGIATYKDIEIDVNAKATSPQIKESLRYYKGGDLILYNYMI